MNLDKLRAGERSAVFVLENTDVFLGSGLEDIRRVRVHIFPIQAEGHPPVSSNGQIDVSHLLGGHLGGVKVEQLLTILVADPQFPLVGGESGSVGSMRDFLLAGEDPMDKFPLFQIDDVEAHVLAQADVGDAVVLGDGVREDRVLADILDLADHAIIPGIEHG